MTTRRSLLVAALTTPPALSLAATATRPRLAAAIGPDFCGALRLSDRGQTLLDQAQGLANRDWRLANTPATRFRIGSVTKQFAAAAVLKLVEAGRLNLDDAVSRHLPDLPDTWRPLTLRQLLQHTAGIPDFTNLPSYPKLQVQRLKPADVLAEVARMPLEFTPGDRHAYSNSGYVLVGQLLEAVSGQGLAALLDRLLFQPLRLADTAVEQPGDVLARRALGYARDPGQPWRQADYIDMGVPHAAGAMVSTTHDLQRWNEALYGGRVLRPDLLTDMLTPGPGGYGLGVGVRQRPEGRVMAHGGGIDGFSAWLEYREATRRSLVVLSNVDGLQAMDAAARLTMALDGLPPLGDLPLFLRGSMNDWAATQPLRADGTRLVTELDLPAGDHTFKIASEDWQRLDLGGDGSVQPGRDHALLLRGGNLRLRTTAAGRWRFVLDLGDRRAPRLRVQALR